jgi:hypothetical protein
VAVLVEHMAFVADRHTMELVEELMPVIEIAVRGRCPGLPDCSGRRLAPETGEGPECLRPDTTQLLART